MNKRSSHTSFDYSIDTKKPQGSPFTIKVVGSFKKFSGLGSTLNLRM